MQYKDRGELQTKLVQLNQTFLAKVEQGAGWKDLKNLLDDMKVIARHLDQLPGTVVPFDSMPQNKTREISS